MPDNLTPEQRSIRMAAIHSRDTKPELLVRKALFARGFRYRVAPKALKGRPDLVFPKHKAVIFVHGCFWHGHWCPAYRQPKSNGFFWAEKVHRNKVRDHDDVARLLAQGWRVAIVWECAIKGPKKADLLPATIATLQAWLTGSETELELPPPPPEPPEPRAADKG